MNPYASGTWIKGVLLAAILLLAAAPSARAERENCLKYEPFEVSITGRVYSMLYPGPPNYESIADGDMAYRHYFLIPDTPFCTVADPSDELNGDADDVKLVQLVLMKVGMGKWRSYMKKFYGNKVRVTGALYCGITPGSRTPIGMDVNSISIIRSK